MNDAPRSSHSVVPSPRAMPRPWQTLAMVVLVTAAAPRVASADVVLSLTPPAVAARDEVRFDLLVLNDGDELQQYTPPATLACQLTTPDGITPATATRAGANARDAGAVTIGARQFTRIAYAARIVTAGRVIVELVDHPSVATVVQVNPTGIPGAPVTSDTQSASVDGEPVAPAQPSPSFPNPLSMITQRDPNFQSESGLVEFLSYRVKPHEPVYIVGGDEQPTTKFQLSFKYQVFDPNGPLAQRAPVLGGLYFGYSQTSLWDLGGADSNPFFDNSYRPELLVSYDNLDRFLIDRLDNRLLPDWMRLGLQAGFRHESNGRDDLDSRSLNTVYVRPIFTVSGRDGWFVTFAPSVYAYVLNLDDNPDIADYRGNADLRLIVGRGGGVQLAATGRIGNDWDKGSLQLDLTMPIRQLTLNNLDVYFDIQYFTGFGESLRTYDESDSSLRFGISLVR